MELACSSNMLKYCKCCCMCVFENRNYRNSKITHVYESRVNTIVF